MDAGSEPAPSLPALETQTHQVATLCGQQGEVADIRELAAQTQREMPASIKESFQCLFNEMMCRLPCSPHGSSPGRAESEDAEDEDDHRKLALTWLQDAFK